MSWVYRNNYVGPNRRAKRIGVRFFERRGDENRETPGEAPPNALREFVRRGLRWVDHFNYFGPDRRGDDFSFFFLERRRSESVGKPPPLDTALRQLRVRVMNVEDAEDRDQLRERLLATALLAEAQGFAAVAEALATLARTVDGAQDQAGDPRATLHAELNRLELMLG